MINKYLTVEVKPTVTASLQHTAAFSDGDVLFDWTAVQVPKGSSALIGATLMVRPKGDAGPTANNFEMDLVFSKTNTVSLGTINSALDNRPSNDFLGLLEFAAGNYGSTAMPSTVIATTGWGSSVGAPPMVLTPDPTTGDNVGFDTLYVGGIARGAFDFRSINAVNESDFAAGAQTVITMDGTSMDVREHFVAGDVLHAQDDAVLGTVASADSATQITLTAANTDAIDEDDIIYNINPIRAILYLEK
tara:strand:+ start:71 stop:811 length:741 start_codon:yes stop_codon:yes gene_type:complete